MCYVSGGTRTARRDVSIECRVVRAVLVPPDIKSRVFFLRITQKKKSLVKRSLTFIEHLIEGLIIAIIIHRIIG
jgi:hypothetical protein